MLCWWARSLIGTGNCSILTRYFSTCICDNINCIVGIIIPFLINSSPINCYQGYNKWKQGTNVLGALRHRPFCDQSGALANDDCHLFGLYLLQLEKSNLRIVYLLVTGDTTALPTCDFSL